MESIIIKDINETFGEGKYLNINVLVHKPTGYTNVSKLCKLAKKDLYDWMRQDYNKKLIEECEKEVNCEVMIRILDVDNYFRGTYVHRYILTMIGIWISHEFAMKVCIIVDKLVFREHKMIIMDKNNVITRLEEQLKNMEIKFDQQFNKIINDNKITHQKLDIAEERAEHVYDVLQDISKQTVPIDDYETLLIFKYNQTGLKYRYKAIRVNSSLAIKEKQKHLSLQLVTEIKSPNSVEFWKSYKNTHGKTPNSKKKNRIIIHMNGDFNINITEQQFIESLDLHHKRITSKIDNMINL